MAPTNKKASRRDSKEPHVLEARDIPSLANLLSVSTSAGIPDFRSPKTGKSSYSNLARLNLPYPEAVFDIGFFRRNPVPFYTLAHELYPGKFRPTITHSFIKLLENKGLLHTCFTQNIDTLERRAGVSDEKIVEAHGSFASQRCIDCQTEFDDESMKEHVLKKTIAKCKSCGGHVKPDIVFFGEDLPRLFKKSATNMLKADLLIVMGTSLTVHPFASLAGMPDEFCPRVLINLERVGDFGRRSDDVVLLGKCDEVVGELCQELGWEEELLKLWEKTKYSVEGAEEEPAESEDEEALLEKEIEAVTAAIERSLALKSAAEEVAKESKTKKVDALTADEEAETLQIPPKKPSSSPAIVDNEKSDKPGEEVSTEEKPLSSPAAVDKGKVDKPEKPASETSQSPQDTTHSSPAAEGETNEEVKLEEGKL
ncbi:DHS-like NAD/FAD-binding domain-containing protein [Cyathus striatus]|nr:DHS-like NAD/FAD-binding domain-containing protein [Cyathus striatus]